MIKWLTKPAKTIGEKFVNIGAALFFLIIWTTLVVAFYRWLFATGFHSENQMGFWPQTPYVHEFWITIIGICILPPIWEECFYRHVPLQIVKATKKPELILPVLLGISGIFGWLHGDAFNIPIQGVAGLVFGLVYVKNGFSLWSSILVHSAWNTILTLALLNFPQ